jgi:hypothetical protein
MRGAKRIQVQNALTKASTGTGLDSLARHRVVNVRQNQSFTRRSFVAISGVLDRRLRKSKCHCMQVIAGFP